MGCGGDPVASGRVVTVLIDEDGKPAPWPDNMRETLTG
jgi:acyl-CoA thioesterase FadM